jgi:hypothetical protein
VATLGAHYPGRGELALAGEPVERARVDAQQTSGFHGAYQRVRVRHAIKIGELVAGRRSVEDHRSRRA